MNNNGGQYEKVTFAASPLNNGEFIPLVEVGGSATTGNHDNHDNTRPFGASDLARILDFPNMPSPPPPSAPHGHLEFEMDDDDQTIRDDAPPKFPKRFFCLRGSFIFYFDLADVALHDPRRRHGQELPEFLNGPIGVIPLERTTVEFPPGGRRVFREHANTDATQGYELMIRHVPARSSSTLNNADHAGAEGEMGRSGGAKITKRRAPAYLVMDSLGQRDAWAEAIRIRAEAYRKETKLRSTGDGVSSIMEGGMMEIDGIEGGGGGEIVASSRSRTRSKSSSPSRGGNVGLRSIGGDISLLAGIIEEKEQTDIKEALRTFGSQTFFHEKEWLHDYFKNHDEEEGRELCYKMERWQVSIKKGLRGAVLEQYEYFVEASKEMTQMGREVASLKELVQKQVEMFESMKRINFNLDVDLSRPGGGLHGDAEKGENATIEDETTRDSSDDDDDEDNDDDEKEDNDNLEGENEASKRSPSSRKQQKSVRARKRAVTSPTSKSSISKRSNSTIDIPVWIDDTVDEISALVKEYRYSEAAELLMKAKLEVRDILNLNEKLSDKKLSKKDLGSMQRILTELDELSKVMCDRLYDGLRRRNEALKQTFKKERVDLSASTCTLVPPTALNDDSSALQLLVKLGRPQDAASAYAERRSILLNECLQERLICTTKATNNADVVISAAQLSHSFFNALAFSVEGFLDLFSENGKVGIMDDHSESSSINTGSNLNNIPPNALAATCLWCDSELLKFAAVFGTKILGNLMLSPRDVKPSNKISDKIVKFETAADLSHLKEQLRAAEEMGEYVAAGKLRKKIAQQEQEEREGKNDVISPDGTKSSDSGRKVAVDIASKCIDQAFSYASESLNAIGLPLTPRLAEYLRTRLKGAESDIAIELEDKWGHVIFDWKVGHSI